MNYAVIIDHEENKIHYGILENIRTISHSVYSNIEFLLTEFQMNYAINLISLLYPEYSINNSNIKKIS